MSAGCSAIRFSSGSLPGLRMGLIGGLIISPTPAPVNKSRRRKRLHQTASLCEFGKAPKQRFDESLATLNTLSTKLAAGPVVLCLTWIYKGHHVLALSCSPTDPKTVSIYDPNFPNLICTLYRDGYHDTSFETWK